MTREVSSYILFLTAIIAGAFVGTIADYCNVKTCTEYNQVHTMCEYTSPDPAPECGEWRNVGLSTAEKQEILKLHNDFREKVAAGKETRGNPGPQPPAAYMPNLVWDDELETIAQRWANQCDFNHDECRNVDKYWVGQNIVQSDPKGGIKEAFKLWEDEVESFNNEDVSDIDFDADPDYFSEVGHYTQLVWAETNKLGCGRIIYRIPGDKFENQFVVCNYGPAGNAAHEAIYQIQG